jgi:hypothetical protein
MRAALSHNTNTHAHAYTFATPYAHTLLPPSRADSFCPPTSLSRSLFRPTAPRSLAPTPTLRAACRLCVCVCVCVQGDGFTVTDSYSCGSGSCGGFSVTDTYTHNALAPPVLTTVPEEEAVSSSTVKASPGMHVCVCVRARARLCK